MESVNCRRSVSFKVLTHINWLQRIILWTTKNISFILSCTEQQTSPQAYTNYTSIGHKLSLEYSYISILTIYYILYR